MRSFIKVVKTFARSTLPASAEARWTGWRLARRIRRDERLNRYRPAAEVFEEIYSQNKWGGSAGEAHSGYGSLGSAVSDYVSTINKFIQTNDVGTVLDIGCGDFRVGKNIVCRNYIGVDVALSVVEKNRQNFGSPSCQFFNLDAAGPEPLPQADLCLVRQVLQHLSNSQISAILRKLRSFRHVIVTEHQPSGEDFVVANLDKVQGQYTRLYSGSGVYLDRAPFNLQTELLLEAASSSEDPKDIHNRGKIRTFLVKA